VGNDHQGALRDVLEELEQRWGGGVAGSTNWLVDGITGGHLNPLSCQS
jgi:hypothetical protein